MKEAFIFGGVRTPIGNFGGSLAPVRTDDLAAHVLKALREKFLNADFSEVDDVILGCANQAGEDNRNVARMALLLAGYPHKVPGQTVNRLCASGMSATMDGARMIWCGDAELVVTGGVENMTRGPWVIGKAETAYGRDQQMYDSSFGWRFINPKMKELYGTDSMGETAENIAEMFKISREDQDAFAFRSQMKASKARESGRFKEEIVPVEIPQKKGDPRVFADDEFIKPATMPEVLSKLKPAFKKDGSVTAGNSSGLNDGACALLLGTKDAAAKFGLQPLAKIVSCGISGVEPRIMGIGPVEASRKALEKAGLQWKDIDIIELNEAFAAQSLACIRQWGLKDDDERINPNGGAIALGHPLGMSGARIILTATLELQKRNARYALATMCIGVGQGYAVVLERPA
jgi:3-oxoadipyl-CoA thiolase